MWGLKSTVWSSSSSRCKYTSSGSSFKWLKEDLRWPCESIRFLGRRWQYIECCIGPVWTSQQRMNCSRETGRVVPPCGVKIHTGHNRLAMLVSCQRLWWTEWWGMMFLRCWVFGYWRWCRYKQRGKQRCYCSKVQSQVQSQVLSQVLNFSSLSANQSKK